MENYAKSLGTAACAVKKEIANATSMQKNAILAEISKLLRNDCEKILSANKLDLDIANENGMSESMQDRLRLTKDRIFAIADSVDYVISLEDPIGITLSGSVRPNGMNISKVTVPLGVIAIIFESRPNVTVDAAVLCLKSGNTVILRGGKEAYNSNKILCEIMRTAVAKCGFSKDIILFVDDTSREVTTELMKCNGLIDVLIPRGGASLIQAVMQNATIPVIETGTGNCHIYVDKAADLYMAVEIVNNSKTRRVSVCNAAESLLVHKKIANTFLPIVKEKLDEKKVEIYGCDVTRKILGNDVYLATSKDYATEYLDYKISVKVVEDIDEAIAHIAKYSTHHSESIITTSIKDADKFTKEVDSAAVYVNVSTAFTDGGMFGLGAEIGISTQKTHARGPMGLRELTSYKYIVKGDGQIRD